MFGRGLRKSLPDRRIRPVDNPGPAFFPVGQPAPATGRTDPGTSDLLQVGHTGATTEGADGLSVPRGAMRVMFAV